MKRHTTLTVTLALVLSVLLISATSVGAQPSVFSPSTVAGSAFTYQGQLKRNGTSVTDMCDMQFMLYGAANGGAALGTQNRSGVSVSNGLFTIPDLDFGANAFTGEARWLEIAVKCTGDGSFSTLAPRQALTPAPYAASLIPSATITGLLNLGNASFGSTTRQMLNLWGTQYGIGVQNHDAYFRTDDGAGFAWFAGGAHSDAHYQPGTQGRILMTLDTNGVTVNNGMTVYGSGYLAAPLMTLDANGMTVTQPINVSINSADSGAALVGSNVGSGYGLYGESNSSSGVIGLSNGISTGAVSGVNFGGGYGIKGISQGPVTSTLVGVYGESVVPSSDVAHGVGVKGKGGEIGVLGEGDTGVSGLGTAGVYGYGSSFGVIGESTSSFWSGVWGHSNSGIGVWGQSNSNNGVQGQSSSDAASGVYGENLAGGYGVAGRADGVGTGVLGDNSNSSGYAGYFNGRVHVQGNLEFTGNLVGGNKLGYVSDFALNDSQETLSTGDVVVVVGYTTPVVGTIPVARVVKASIPYQSGVVGVVDQHVTRGDTLRFVDEPVAPGEYLNIVTLGMYRMVKVDANLGAIHAGDLLVASSHAGCAMKVTDRTQAAGAIIGKALGDLAGGEGALADYRDIAVRLTMKYKMIVLILVLVLALPLLTYAQSGGGYDLSWSTIDGGGGTSSSGGYSLSGTIGQSAAGGFSSGDYTLAGGFWNDAEPAGTYPVYLPLVLR